MKKIITNLVREIRLLITHKWGGVWNYRHGFLPSTRSVCKIDQNNYEDFLSDRDYLSGHPWNGAYTGIIDNKLYLPLLLSKYPEHVPVYYYFKDQSGFLSLCDFVGQRETIDDFFDLLNEKKKLCLKHTHSSVGVGFMLIEKIDESYYINGEAVDYQDLRMQIDNLREYIVTEYIQQHDWSANICSTSLNTIRFLCAWDYEKKEFFLARCFHRFGCNGNVVDNVGSGNGLLVFVDPDTGTCKSNGAINVNGSGDRFVENIVHPDNNIELSGLKIPRFDEIKTKVLEIANSISYLRWVGFDVAITKDSFVIIETNSLSSLIDQECEGYLKDKRLRRIFNK